MQLLVGKLFIIDFGTWDNEILDVWYRLNFLQKKSLKLIKIVILILLKLS